MKSHKMGKIPKSRFPKMVKKSLKIRNLIWNHIEWEKSENQNFLESLKGNGKSKKSYKIAKHPKIEFSFRCVELRENPENLGFTFFGFLPPYLGVSDSLAYFKRRGLKRSIVSYKKSLISCLWLGIRPFLCLNPWRSMEIHGSPWK